MEILFQQLIVAIFGIIISVTCAVPTKDASTFYYRIETGEQAKIACHASANGKAYVIAGYLWKVSSEDEAPGWLQ